MGSASQDFVIMAFSFCAAAASAIRALFSGFSEIGSVGSRSCNLIGEPPGLSRVEQTRIVEQMSVFMGDTIVIVSAGTPVCKVEVNSMSKGLS